MDQNEIKHLLSGIVLGINASRMLLLAELENGSTSLDEESMDNIFDYIIFDFATALHDGEEDEFIEEALEETEEVAGELLENFADRIMAIANGEGS